MVTLKKEELSQLINDAVSSQLKAAVAPLEEKTQWMSKIYGSEIRQPQDERVESPKQRGIGAARLVRAYAFARGDQNRAYEWAQKAQGAKWKDMLGESVVKVLEAGDLTAGGFMIPEDMAEGIIDFLRARSVVRRAGPQILPMPRGSITLPRTSGTVTANYVGESAAITESEPTGDQIVLSSKKLAVLTPLSNELLRFDVGDQADRWVRNEMVREMARREDAAFIRDDGTQNKPKGMRYWAGNVTASNGTSSANIESDIKQLINDLEGNNVELQDTAFFMAPRSKNHLANLRDANGNLVYPSIRDGIIVGEDGRVEPGLFGRPVFVTTNVPTNLGSGTNESEVYLANMNDLVIGEAGGIEIEVDPGASYTTGGSLVSAFERDQTVIRAISHHDFAVMHNNSVAVINQITWGA